MSDSQFADFTRNIHYCWLGSAVPDRVGKRVDSWKAIHPDFTFYEWNDSNTDVSGYEYGRRCVEERRWSFVSDVVRLQKLYEYGGFYMDVDVELRRPLDQIPASGDHLILGYMYDFAFSCGFFYAPPKHPLIKLLLDCYNDIRHDFYPCNNTIVTSVINNNVPQFLLRGRYWSNDEYRISVFPKEYFCQPSLLPGKSFAVDHFAGSWRNTDGSFVISRGTLGPVTCLKRKVRNLLQIRRSEFSKLFFLGLLGKKKRIVETWRESYDGPQPLPGQGFLAP